DHAHEALFLRRGERHEDLWSSATFEDEGVMQQALLRRALGDADWACSHFTSGCVMAVPRTQASSDETAALLLDRLIRARVHYEGFGPPYIPGLLTPAALGQIVDSIYAEMEANRRA